MGWLATDKQHGQYAICSAKASQNSISARERCVQLPFGSKSRGIKSRPPKTEEKTQ